MGRPVSLDELIAAREAERTRQKGDISPVNARLPKEAKIGKPKPEVHPVHRAFQRPPHAVVLLVLASVIAYLLLAVGWGLRGLGDCIWQVGEWIHEDKWGIK